MNQIESSFQALYGLPCWNAKSGYGSFLTMEFGAPHLEIREPREPKPDASDAVRRFFEKRHVVVHGEWHLWIYCCEWWVYTGDRLVGDSDPEGSTKERIDLAARELDGQKLVSVAVDATCGESVFTSDLGSRLVTKPDDDSVQWYLYEPNGFVLSYRADGRISHQPGDTSPDEERWLSLG
ncbi:MAG: hypothetical protein ACO1SX_17350 [Actinomycetota bacterium]